MIRNFRHRGLKRLYGKGDASRVKQEHVTKLRDILFYLDAATGPGDMDRAGFHLHPLKGRRRGEWAVTVTGNWRVTFGFDGPNAENVGYEDYH